jgi:uncharacterized protein GlcG (DUF336 family)
VVRRRLATTGILLSALALVQLSCGGTAGKGKEPAANPPGVPVCLGGETPGASCATDPSAGPQCPGGLCIAASVCVDATGQATDPAIPCPGGTECPPGTICPDVRLKDDEVRAIIEAGARALDPDQFEVAVAVTDRRGVVLGIGTNFAIDYAAACAESECPGDGFLPGSDAFVVDTALQLARTASFFSADQTPLTSRSVRFISGEHFPAGVANTGAAALFGIENTNRGCSFDAVARPAEAAIPPARNLCSVLAQRDGLPPIPCESSIDPADQCGCSRGILTLPGGVPIYRGVENGLLRMAGGVGAFIRRVVPLPDPVAGYPFGLGILRYDDAMAQSIAGDPLNGQPLFASSEVAAAFFTGTPTGLPNFVPRPPRICDNENITRPACCDQTPRCDFNVIAARNPPFDPVIFIDGIEVPEVATNPPLPPGAGTFGRCSGSGATCRVGGGECLLGEACEAVVTWVVPPNNDAEPVPQGWLFGPFPSTPGALPISAADVQTIINAGFQEARRVRAGIRLPLQARTAMMLAVSDSNNALLGLFRMQDATVFSIDVAVAKSRNVTYFSSPDINPLDAMDCPGPSDPPNSLGDCRGTAYRPGTAVTNRTLSFGAQPFFPSGIEGQLAGFPFPFEPGPFRQTFIYDSANPCTNGLEVPDGRQNGIVFFPGSTPIYRNDSLVNGTGPLIGGYGVSGDGVEQDDIVTVGGARADTNAQGYLPNSRIRADQVFVRGVRLPFVKFNRRPEQ